MDLRQQQTQTIDLQFQCPNDLLFTPSIVKFSFVLDASFEVLWACSEMIDVSMLPQECFKVLKSLHFRLVGVDLFFCVGLVAFSTV